MRVGQLVQLPQGYRAFVPSEFPPGEETLLDQELINLLAKANLSLGNLNGITQLLPDIDFFIFMYVRKEAALSSQIEGTQATMINAIEAEVEFTKRIPKDVNDIQHYIKAMNFGLNRLNSLPLSLRLIREVHKELLTGARIDHFADPGEFRTSQNWIGGNSPGTAKFVPPPVDEMKRALDDFEKFLHSQDQMNALIKTALAHAQFETIHPFLDGNGRTGRLLITFYLCQQKILDKPVLYLSEYFKKNRDTYFNLLHDYHNEGEVARWFKFFLQGVAEVADDAVKTSKKITILQKKDIVKIQSLGRTAETAMRVLEEFYKLPIVNVRKIQEWTKTSRVAANTLTNKFVKIGILQPRNQNVRYGRTFYYKDYLDIFTA